MLSKKHNNVISNSFLLIFCYVILTFTSSYISEVIQLPYLFVQGLNLLLYLPFAGFIIRKLIIDLRKRRIHSSESIYYLFLTYCVMLIFLRTIWGEYAKETIYYTLIMCGTTALFLTKRGDLLELNGLENSIICFNIFILLYRFTYMIIFRSWISHQPINVILTTSVSILMLPFYIMELRYKRKNSSFVCILFLLNLIAILTSSSRSITLMSICLIVIIGVKNLTNRRMLLWLLSGSVVSLGGVGVLVYYNLGNIRYAFARVFNLFLDKFSSVLSQDGILSIAGAQISRSDDMRKQLMLQGIEEIKKNPFWGTGNTFYTYGDITSKQSSHNFLIETGACYGLIGLILLMLLLMLLLIFSFRQSSRNSYVYFSLKMTFVSFFTISLVQPIMYSPATLPVFMLLILFFQKMESYYSNIWQ